MKLKKENQKEFSEELFNKLGKENADKKNEFVNALQINWSENINQAVNDLWIELKKHSEKLLETDSVSFQLRSNSDISMEVFVPVTSG